MKARYIISPLILISSVLACSGSEIRPLELFDEPSKVEETVVYGSDDRMDYYQMTDPVWQARALSTVALVSASKVVPEAGGVFSLKSMPYGKSMGLCPREPFYNQVSSAFCSGSLIAPDIILTAGHCVVSQKKCEDTRFIFNFAYKSLGNHPVSLKADDVYSCKELIHQELNNPGSLDYALIRLNRPVVGHAPLPIRQSGRIADGEALTVIGYPKGIPLKVAGGASVRHNQNRYFFVANLDTYAGNSGSPVFNEKTGVIEGVLVRGEQDMVFTEEGCYVSNVCPADGCRGEDVTRVQWALPYLDPAELPSSP